MNTQQSLLLSAASVLLIHTLFYSTTTSAQVSPLLSPSSPPPSSAEAQAPGFNTVPLVPVSPSGAPTPNILPKTPSIDIIQILKKAKRFTILTRLLKTTQLINQLNSQLLPSSSTSSGLTLFAPEDTAFSKLKPGFLNSLSDRNKVELLQFHTLSSSIAISNFDTLTNPVQTQAGDDAKRLQLNVTTYGGSKVSMTTGAVNATVTGTVYTDSKLAIYQVDKVLVPLDLVLPIKRGAPAPAPAGTLNKPKGGDDKIDSHDDDSVVGGNKASPGEASAAVANTFNVKGMWLPLVLAVALKLAGEAMILS